MRTKTKLLSTVMIASALAVTGALAGPKPSRDDIVVSPELTINQGKDGNFGFNNKGSHNLGWGNEGTGNRGGGNGVGSSADDTSTAGSHNLGFHNGVGAQATDGSRAGNRNVGIGNGSATNGGTLGAGRGNCRFT